MDLNDMDQLNIATKFLKESGNFPFGDLVIPLAYNGHDNQQKQKFIEIMAKFKDRIVDEKTLELISGVEKNLLVLKEDEKIYKVDIKS